VVMVILTTGKTFPLFTWNHFWALGTLEFGPRVRPPPVKWSAIAESLRNTGLGKQSTKYCNEWLVSPSVVDYGFLGVFMVAFSPPPPIYSFGNEPIFL
jgi:hypothetical protein